MLFFSLLLSHNDLQLLRQQLSSEKYCLIETDTSRLFYGILQEIFFNEFISILSSDALQHLEYLDVDEFKTLIRSRSPHHDLVVHEGSQELFDYVLTHLVDPND
ncbi:MAG: hypothetical protein JNK79_19345 [Chitinophagaceae bacterium]|nr:hypothetical protein [Chitinophagaceae bacterium]